MSETLWAHRHTNTHTHSTCGYDGWDELCAHVRFSHIQHKEQSYVSITNTHNYYYDIPLAQHTRLTRSVSSQHSPRFGPTILLFYISSHRRWYAKKYFLRFYYNDMKRYRRWCVRARARKTSIYHLAATKGIYCARAHTHNLLLFLRFTKRKRNWSCTRQLSATYTAQANHFSTKGAPRAQNNSSNANYSFWRIHFLIAFVWFVPKSIASGERRGELISKATTQNIEYHPWSRCHGLTGRTKERNERKTQHR